MNAPKFPAVLLFADTCYVMSRSEFLSSPKTLVSDDGTFLRNSATLGYYDDFLVLDCSGSFWKCVVMEEKKINFIFFLIGQGRLKVKFRFDGPHNVTVAELAKLLLQHPRGRRANSVLKEGAEKHYVDRDIARQIIKRIRPDLTDSAFEEDFVK